MAPEHQIRTLFESSLLRIEDVRCRGSRREKQPEEQTTRHEIAIPRSGVFMRHDAAGNTLVDPNHILFFNQGQPYQVSHPAPGGDRSTVFVLEASCLIDLLNSLDPSTEYRPEGPFSTHHIVLDTRLRLLQYWLIHLAAPSDDEPLAVEEKVLVLLGSALGYALQYARRPKAQGTQATRREHADLAEQVKGVLSERFQEGIKLEEIARMTRSPRSPLTWVFPATIISQPPFGARSTCRPPNSAARSAAGGSVR